MLILIAENNPAHVLLITKSLGDFKNVEIATDGRAAIDRLKREPVPDLLLLDLNMPVAGGFDVLKAKHRTIARFTPTIVLSTSADQRDINRAYELGATAYMVKPGYVELKRWFGALFSLCYLIQKHETFNR